MIKRTLPNFKVCFFAFIQPENSAVDYEISLEGLDLSFSRGVTRISPFFAVHVQPPDSRVRLLLEGGIGDLLQRLSTKSTSVEVPEQQEQEREGELEKREGGMHAADDVVVEYIAAILIKVRFDSFASTSLLYGLKVLVNRATEWMQYRRKNCFCRFRVRGYCACGSTDFEFFLHGAEHVEALFAA